MRPATARPARAPHLPAPEQLGEGLFFRKDVFIMNSGNCFVVGILVAMSFQFPSNGGRGACFSGLILTVTPCCSVRVCTDFCCSVRCCNQCNQCQCSHQITAAFKLSLLVAFMLISILINCSFIPAAHVCIASVTIIVTCSASIVVVVPVLDTRHWSQSCRLIPAIGRVETSVSHRRSH